MSFWNDLTTPFFSLAPMEDVTDTSFRELIMTISAPECLQVVFSEFTSVDGFLDYRGHEKVAERLFISDTEKKLLKERGIRIVAQIWGSEPEKFYQTAARIYQDYEFDGIDINMGCPVKKIIKHNACSGLIGFPDLAREIVEATREGSPLPVSVKTRTGLKEHQTEVWIENILKANPAAITLHGRTQKQLSDGNASWEEIKKAVEVRNRLSPTTPKIGNGDIISFQDGLEHAASYGTDGIMVGTGIFKDPWLFNQYSSDHPPLEKFDVLLRHIHLFEKNNGSNKNYNILKRFFKIYVTGFPGASSIRDQLMHVSDPEAFRKIIYKSIEKLEQENIENT
jgi:nifR3 family TIM-barrel protein